MGELKQTIILMSLILIILIVGGALLFLVHYLPILMNVYLSFIITITISFAIVALFFIPSDEDDEDEKDRLFKEIKFLFRLWLIFSSWFSILFIITLIAITYENKITTILAIISYVLSFVLFVTFPFSGILGKIF
jgi:hypothetical protein